RTSPIYPLSLHDALPIYKISELLTWCRETGVEVVTVWMLSNDNLNRPPHELEPLLRIIEDVVQELVGQGWRIIPVGALDLLPDRDRKSTRLNSSHVKISY